MREIQIGKRKKKGEIHIGKSEKPNSMMQVNGKRRFRRRGRIGLDKEDFGLFWLSKEKDEGQIGAKNCGKKRTRSDRANAEKTSLQRN